jgi:hypothetical protein
VPIPAASLAPTEAAIRRSDEDLQALLRTIGYRARVVAYQRHWPYDMDPPSFDDHIYVRPFDGTSEVDVTEGLTDRIGAFSWSPTGEWIVFTSSRAEDGGPDPSRAGSPAQLWSVRADGSDRRPLLVTHGLLSVHWSMDGRSLVSNCLVEGDPLRICIVDIDSGTVATTPHLGEAPQISPDGLHYAWYDEERVLWVADTLSHTPRILLGPSSEWFRGFSWSHDAAAILTSETVVELEDEGINTGFPCAGSSTFVRIDIASGERQSLGTIPLPVTDWEGTSADDRLALVSAPRCQGNVYTFHGIASVDGESVSWPITEDSWAFISWAPDDLHLLQWQPLYRRLLVVEPITGTESEVPDPTWISEILSREQLDAGGVWLSWRADPGGG